nr:MAG TPA: hypothetical protein [Caudoviricetes sp.]
MTRQVFLLVSIYFLLKYELIRNHKKSFTSYTFTSCQSVHRLSLALSVLGKRCMKISFSSHKTNKIYSYPLDELITIRLALKFRYDPIL